MRGGQDLGSDDTVGAARQRPKHRFIAQLVTDSGHDHRVGIVGGEREMIFMT